MTTPTHESSQPQGDILHRGSVKDIYQGSKTGELVFKFSDRYSVFDWGEMPDLLEEKGKALAFMGVAFFQWLEKPRTWTNWKPSIPLSTSEQKVWDFLKKHGLSHHCLTPLSQFKENLSSSFTVEEVNVPRLPFEEGRYHYNVYQDKPTNTLVPLEVVFRFGLPAGSSLLKRLGDDDYRRVLGLNHKPVEGEKFARPLIEFSTKLESTDRYLSYEQAQKLAGLNDTEFSHLFNTTALLSLRLKDFFEEMGIVLWDGKFEYAFGDYDKLEHARTLKLVDSIGPDELRLTYAGQKLSKEFLRSFYRGSSWLDSVEKAKNEAFEKGVKDWKSALVENNIVPDKLPGSYKKAATDLYKCLANGVASVVLGENIFQDADSLDELSTKMKTLGKENEG